MSVLFRTCLAAMAFVAVGAFASSASAQTTVYPVKVVCGFENGNGPYFGAPTTPRTVDNSLKPGEYGVSVDILSLNATDTVLSAQFIGANGARIVRLRPGSVSALSRSSRMP